MSTKNNVEIDLGFPVYGLRFVNNSTVLVCGGGGEGKNGIPNKITAIRCSFNVSDKNRRLQKFREITLPSNEDSPMCIDFSKNASAENIKYSIFVGCNQSTELIKSMNINNNLRKYVYNDEEHLEFSDAVQFDDNLSTESIGEYPKIVQTARDSSIGALMTSRIPSEIFIFNPESLELNLRFKPSSPYEIKDFNINPEDGGQTLTYVTASFIETISSNSGKVVSSSLSADKKTAGILQNYFFSKIRYVSDSKVLVTGAKKNGKGSAIIEYDINLKKVTRERLISSKIKGIVAIDVSSTAGLVAVAGNDFSVSLLRLSDLKVVKSYTKLHAFAVTCLSFSPNGKKLATGSASNSLKVLQIPSKSGGILSFIGSLFKYAFLTILVGILSIYIQQAHEKGDLDQFIELSRIYGGDALTISRHYAKIGFDLSRKYGAEYYQHAHHYGKIAYGVAKEKGFEGFDLLKEKLSKKEDQPPSILTDKSDWTKEVERTTTISTADDHSTQIIGDTHDLKKASGDLDTDSIINEATRAILDETPTSVPVDSKDLPQSGSESELPSLAKASSALNSDTSENSPVVESAESEDPAQSVMFETVPSVNSAKPEDSPPVETLDSEIPASFESAISVEPPADVEILEALNSESIAYNTSVPSSSTAAVDSPADSKDATDQSQQTVLDETSSGKNQSDSDVQDTSIASQDEIVSEDIIIEELDHTSSISPEEPKLNLTEQEPKEQIQFQEQVAIKNSLKPQESGSEFANQSNQNAPSDNETVDSTTSESSSDIETPESPQEAPSSTTDLEDPELSSSAQDPVTGEISPEAIPSPIEKESVVTSETAPTQDSTEVIDIAHDKENSGEALMPPAENLVESEEKAVSETKDTEDTEHIAVVESSPEVDEVIVENVQDVINERSQRIEVEEVNEPSHKIEVEEVVNEPAQNIAVEEIVNEPSQDTEVEEVEEPTQKIKVEEVVEEPAQKIEVEEVAGEPSQRIEVEEVVNEPAQSIAVEEIVNEPSQDSEVEEVINELSQDSKAEAQPLSTPGSEGQEHETVEEKVEGVKPASGEANDVEANDVEANDVEAIEAQASHDEL